MKLTASNGFTVMVESPLYFHSIRPVLASLQKFDMDSFPLMPEIVRCQPSEHIPEYLSEDITLNASSIFADKSDAEDSLLELEKIDKLVKEFNELEIDSEMKLANSIELIFEKVRIVS